MDYQSPLAGAISGLFISLMTAFGWNKRLNNVEGQKQDKSVCEERWRMIESMQRDLSYIRDRLDTAINSRGKG